MPGLWLHRESQALQRQCRTRLSAASAKWIPGSWSCRLVNGHFLDCCPVYFWTHLGALALIMNGHPSLKHLEHWEDYAWTILTFGKNYVLLVSNRCVSGHYWDLCPDPENAWTFDFTKCPKLKAMQNKGPSSIVHRNYLASGAANLWKDTLWSIVHILLGFLNTFRDAMMWPHKWMSLCRPLSRLCLNSWGSLEIQRYYDVAWQA